MKGEAIGVDIGGTGMKAALVDLADGALISERLRIDTPRPASPELMVPALRELISDLPAELPVGVGFPAVVSSGVVRTANNIDPSWIGRDLAAELHHALGRPVPVLNDADAAAVAEAAYGAARDVTGVVVVITFGTGIGSGLVADGVLVPNLELGQLEVAGHLPAEAYFSARARKQDGLTWEEWGDRANRYLQDVARVINPSLILVAGGAAKRWDMWSGRLDQDVEIRAAGFGNNAGIVGAARHAVSE